MNKKITALLFLLLSFLQACGQVDTGEVFIDSTAVDTVAINDTIDVALPDNVITNTSALSLFYEKLYLMEQQKAGKVNIVHIGDSHIQADLMTNCIRKRLQEFYGNGGAGFTFPHQLAKTNGSYNTRFKSNTGWESRRNISPIDNSMAVGLSGFALQTRHNFAVEVDVKDPAYAFNTVKIITPGNQPMFDVATSSRTVVLESTEPKKITHRIKNGEVLGSIARKYGVSIAEIKRANGMKTDRIRAGKTLKIPTDQKESREVRRSEFVPLTLQGDALSHFYHSDAALDKIYLLPNEGQSPYSLSGLVLENDAPGVLYHSIGVNGAKASDFNKYPLFFEQLPALMPDLIVVSLGTNESFDKMPAEDYIVQLNALLANIKKHCPDAPVIIMTPPPSQFKRKYPNTFVASYAKSILVQESLKSYATWDLYSAMGGVFGVPRNAKRGIIGGDRVHYTKNGYEVQGRLFCEAFVRAYDNFKTNRKD